MSAVALLGLLSTLLSIALMWPQVWLSCVNRRTNGLSATACWLGTALSGSWLLYGLMIRDVAQVATNVVSTVANAAVLVALLATQPLLRGRRALATTASGAAAMGVAGAGALTLAATPDLGAAAVGAAFGALVSAVSIVAGLPQPVSLLRSPGQDLSGISPARWCLSATACTSWTAYGLIAGQAAVWTSALFGLLCALVVCGVLLRQHLATVTAVTQAETPQAAVQALAGPVTGQHDVRPAAVALAA